jgi:N-carbamoylputrescine amidase
VTRVAVVQLRPDPASADASLASATEGARSALADGADVAVLPELAIPGYTWRRDLLEAAAEPVDGPAVAAWVAVAAETGGLIAGGLAERDGDRLFDTAVLVGPEGLILHYRKLHLFSGEREVFSPGDRGLPIARTTHGVIGLCVCYDLRFVETLRALALSGAELVAVPTAWVAGFDAVQWDADGFCPQARGALLQANLDGVFVACASQAGTATEHRLLGSSIIGDPRGRCLAGPLGPDAAEVAMAEVNLQAVEEAQDRGGGIRPTADRRTDVYRLEVDGERL